MARLFPFCLCSKILTDGHMRSGSGPVEALALRSQTKPAVGSHRASYVSVSLSPYRFQILASRHTKPLFGKRDNTCKSALLPCPCSAAIEQLTGRKNKAQLVLLMNFWSFFFCTIGCKGVSLNSLSQTLYHLTLGSSLLFLPHSHSILLLPPTPLSFQG